MIVSTVPITPPGEARETMILLVRDLRGFAVLLLTIVELLGSLHVAIEDLDPKDNYQSLQASICHNVLEKQLPAQ